MRWQEMVLAPGWVAMAAGKTLFAQERSSHAREVENQSGKRAVGVIGPGSLADRRSNPVAPDPARRLDANLFRRQLE